MSNVLFSRTSDPSSKPITDGQLIFDTSGNGKMYLDVGDERLEMGGAIDIDSTLDPTSENPIQNKAVAGVMLNTLEEINEVTTKGKLTDALATKELNTNVENLNTDIEEIQNDYISKGKILESLEEVTTATGNGFVPDALAIKELDTDLQGKIDTLNSNLENLSTYDTIGTIASTSFTEFDIDYSVYRYIGIAYINIAGSVYNLNIIPVSLFKTFTSSNVYINNIYTTKRYIINAYYKENIIVANINTTELSGVIYGIK